MKTLIITISLSAFLFLIAGFGLGIRYFLTGKKMSRGSCGFNPNTTKVDCNKKKPGCSICSYEKPPQNK